MISRKQTLAFALAMLFSLGVGARAVILFRTADPTANTTAPTGRLADSGWQFEGTLGDFLGTPIAPHFFITAAHIGIPAGKFSYHGSNYTTVQTFDDPGSDLRIFKVAETFPTYAPLYVREDEVGRNLVVVGRGSKRGTESALNGQLQGWNWGTGDTTQRWGENQVASIVSLGQVDMLYALFDQAGLPEEAHLSTGDSGGGVFIQDGDVWKLAGINYDVDSFASGPDGGGPYNAALFDERGRYRRDGTLITGNGPVPSGFYATRISTRIAWIRSIIEPGLANISTRAEVGTGDQVCISGFILQGDATQTKRVVIRGLGPSLQVDGVPLTGRMSDPLLAVYDATGRLIASNDNWRSSQATALQNIGFAPTQDSEAALIATLSPGTYTAVLRGAGDTTGTGLIEIYDLDPRPNSRLVNLSARAYVGTQDDALIGGLIVSSVSERVLLRVLGPELGDRGVEGELLDPILELHDSSGTMISANDNWPDAPNQAEIVATGMAPSDPREPVILSLPAPGNYTAVVRGKDGTTGIALLEAYLLD